MKINSKKLNKKYLLAFVATVVILICSGGYFLWSNGYFGNSQIKNGVDYSPAVKTDKELNDDVKESLPIQDSDSTTVENEPTEDRTKVTPVISVWGQPGGPGTDMRVNGYVPNIIEADGTCTLTLTKDTASATASKTSLQNAKDTSCGQLSIPYSSLSNGMWSAVLNYSSSTSEGSSTKVDIEVR